MLRITFLYNNVHISTFKYHSCFLQRTVLEWHTPELKLSHISVCENPSPAFYWNWFNQYGDTTCGLHTRYLLHVHALTQSLTYTNTHTYTHILSSYKVSTRNIMLVLPQENVLPSLPT